MTAGEERVAPAGAANVARADFVLHGVVPPTVRPEVAASWRRSVELVSMRGTASPPFLVAPPVRIGEAVKCVCDTAETADEVLPMVLVLDAQARVLERCVSDARADLADQVGLTVGADLSERGLGTTAVGLAMASGEPERVTGAEHLLPSLVAWTSGAVPVRDGDGALVCYLASFEQGLGPAATSGWLQVVAALLEVELGR